MRDVSEICLQNAVFDGVVPPQAERLRESNQCVENIDKEASLCVRVHLVIGFNGVLGVIISRMRYLIECT